MTDRVRVFCNAPSHSSRVAELETFERVNGVWRIADRPVTGDAAARGLSGADWQEKALRRLKPASVERVVGDQVYPGRSSSASSLVGHDGAGHVRYHLRCPLCGLDAQVRQEKWHGRLDTLAQHGVYNVSLEAVAATL